MVARVTTAVLHRDRAGAHDLLEASCPGCRAVLVTAAPMLVRDAVAARVTERPLVPPPTP